MFFFLMRGVIELLIHSIAGSTEAITVITLFVLRLHVM